MIRHLLRSAISAILVTGLQGCAEKKQEASEQPVRGLRAYKVAATAESRVRRFPSVLQPADVSSLSFEIGGQLKAVILTVGQKVQLGDVLAEIDPRSLQTQADQASAGVQQAQALLDNAEADFQRKDELLKRGVATQAVFDQSRATSAQLASATRAGASSTRAGKSQPGTKQAAGAVRRHHRSRRGQILCPGRCGAADRHAVQRRPLRDVVSGTVRDVPEPDGRADGRRQDRRHTRPPAQGRDQGARVEGRAGISLSGRDQARQQRPGPERGHVRGSQDRGTLDRRAEAAFWCRSAFLCLKGARCCRTTGTVFRYDDASSTVQKRTITVGGVRDNRLVVTEGIASGRYPGIGRRLLSVRRTEGEAASPGGALAVNLLTRFGLARSRFTIAVMVGLLLAGILPLSKFSEA